MSKLDFKVLAQRGKARVGQITLNGITLTTPVFMPVGTKATIKGVPLFMLNKEYLWADNDIKLILANTFHLFLHPWTDIIAKAGGLHAFEARDWLLLTDSGGFQVFSLWLSKHGKPLAKLQEDGVMFSSPYDGSRHFFSPANVVDMQRKFGSDIMMMLDVCSPVDNISKQTVTEHMHITHRRAKEAYEYHMQWYDTYRWVLFPIVQGGLHEDLRQESVETLSSYAKDWIAIWWLSVWESKEEMHHILSHIQPHLPNDIPRYLMWVGTPEDLLMAIEEGIDMFDCVMPTRVGRHGWAFSKEWTIKLKNSGFKDDMSKLDSTCQCYTCRTFTKSYLHHLIKENEMLGATLLSLHNIAYLHCLLEDRKKDILESQKK